MVCLAAPARPSQRQSAWGAEFSFKKRSSRVSGSPGPWWRADSATTLASSVRPGTRRSTSAVAGRAAGIAPSRSREIRDFRIAGRGSGFHGAASERTRADQPGALGMRATIRKDVVSSSSCSHGRSQKMALYDPGWPGISAQRSWLPQGILGLSWPAVSLALT